MNKEFTLICTECHEKIKRQVEIIDQDRFPVNKYIIKMPSIFYCDHCRAFQAVEYDFIIPDKKTRIVDVVFVRNLDINEILTIKEQGKNILIKTKKGKKKKLSTDENSGPYFI